MPPEEQRAQPSTSATLVDPLKSQAAGGDGPAPAPEPLPSPRERYEIVSKVARGGMSTIYRARDKSLGRFVAMKIVNEDVATRADGLHRFIHESRITGRLDHPNIVPVHDLGVDDSGNHYFTMKLVEGCTLDQLIQAKDYEYGSPESLRRFIEILHKVCDALSFAHSRGVVHRDIKPDNIMVGSYGQVYLMDWGVARDLHAADELAAGGAAPSGKGHQTESGRIIGTPQYLAPEQARGEVERVDQRTDIFALGAVLYEILTLRPPYQGVDSISTVRKAYLHQIDEPTSPTPGVHLPPGLCRIAMKALAEDPGDRYQTVADFQDELGRFSRGAWKYETRTFDTGTVIMREGEEGHTAYIILQGTCEVFRAVGGREIVLARMIPGDTFGETAVFTKQVRSASVRAIDKVVTKVVDRSTFEQWLGVDSWIGSFVRVLAERFREQSGRNTELISGLEDAEVVNWAISEMNFCGYPISDREVITQWSALRARVAERFARDDRELDRLFSGQRLFFLDRNKDRITLVRPE
jgi:serine/threonine-protein kinase